MRARKKMLPRRTALSLQRRHQAGYRPPAREGGGGSGLRGCGGRRPGSDKAAKAASSPGASDADPPTSLAGKNAKAARWPSWFHGVPWRVFRRGAPKHCVLFRFPLPSCAPGPGGRSFTCSPAATRAGSPEASASSAKPRRLCRARSWASDRLRCLFFPGACFQRHAHPMESLFRGRHPDPEFAGMAVCGCSPRPCAP